MDDGQIEKGPPSVDFVEKIWDYLSVSLRKKVETSEKVAFGLDFKINKCYC